MSTDLEKFSDHGIPIIWSPLQQKIVTKGRFSIMSKSKWINQFALLTTHSLRLYESIAACSTGESASVVILLPQIQSIVGDWRRINNKFEFTVMDHTGEESKWTFKAPTPKIAKQWCCMICVASPTVWRTQKLNELKEHEAFLSASPLGGGGSGSKKGYGAEQFEEVNEKLVSMIAEESRKSKGKYIAMSKLLKYGYTVPIDQPYMVGYSLQLTKVAPLRSTTFQSMIIYLQLIEEFENFQPQIAKLVGDDRKDIDILTDIMESYPEDERVLINIDDSEELGSKKMAIGTLFKKKRTHRRRVKVDYKAADAPLMKGDSEDDEDTSTLSPMSSPSNYAVGGAFAKKFEYMQEFSVNDDSSFQDTETTTATDDSKDDSSLRDLSKSKDDGDSSFGGETDPEKLYKKTIQRMLDKVDWIPILSQAMVNGEKNAQAMAMALTWVLMADQDEDHRGDPLYNSDLRFAFYICQTCGGAAFTEYHKFGLLSILTGAPWFTMDPSKQATITARRVAFPKVWKSFLYLISTTPKEMRKSCLKDTLSMILGSHSNVRSLVQDIDWTEWLYHSVHEYLNIAKSLFMFGKSKESSPEAECVELAVTTCSASLFSFMIREGSFGKVLVNFLFKLQQIPGNDKLTLYFAQRVLYSLVRYIISNKAWIPPQFDHIAWTNMLIFSKVVRDFVFLCPKWGRKLDDGDDAKDVLGFDFTKDEVGPHMTWIPLPMTDKKQLVLDDVHILKSMDEFLSALKLDTDLMSGKSKEFIHNAEMLTERRDEIKADIELLTTLQKAVSDSNLKRSHVCEYTHSYFTGASPLETIIMNLKHSSSI